ncbi:WEB family [Sesbania bispinosa]|nr:WEB family [Sesbania bispinosa]
MRRICAEALRARDKTNQTFLSQVLINKCKSLNLILVQKLSSRAKELHRARRDIDLYKQRTRAAEFAKAQAEPELSNANKTVKILHSMIEESSYKAKDQMLDITSSLNKLGKVSRNDNNEYSEVMRELEYAKQELFQLKLDVASVLEEKLQAEKEVEESRSNMMSCSRVAQVVRKEIEEANEEQVIVELARIDALKELRDIEAGGGKEPNEILFKFESARNKLKEAIKEVDESKEIEMKLAMTMSDVDVLQNELKLVKKMEKRVQRDKSMEHMEGSLGEGKESRDFHVLQTIKEEIEEAKKDLALIREEGFHFMASMDDIRKELKHVTAEEVHLKKVVSKGDSKVQNLKSKILREKSKLEAVSDAEEKAKSIVITFSHTLEKLKTETVAAKADKELINQEVNTTKSEIKKGEFEKDMAEERLQGAMQELEAMKTSEGLALEKLKTLTENAMTMRDRSLETQPSSFITISKFEYEYLTNHAAEAKEIADKKVAAAKAWIEAAKASEKEILMKTKIAEGMKLEVYTKEKLVTKGVRNEELEKWSRKREKNPSRGLQRTMSRKSNKSDGSMTPSKGSKFQKSTSPASRQVSPFIIKKKKKH